MKRIYYLLLIALLASCHDELENEYISGDAVELTRIEATIVGDQQTRTRADGDPQTPVVYLQDHISRFRFVDKDEMTFTTIRRSTNPIPRFNYQGISFKSNNTGAWDRDKTTGSDADNGTSVHPERIYWSDATSTHTFIGYSLPQQYDQAAPEFDWRLSETTYYGSIGDPNAQTMINYNPAIPETDTYTTKDKDGTEKPVTIPASSLMKAEDLLLAYDTVLVPVNAVANVKFYHALSSVKVQVVLSEFYGSELDGYAIVENMILKSQPTLYRWEQTSYKAAAKSNTHSENNPRDMFLWDYVPEGTGTNAGKTFTFYGITVPQEGEYQFQDLKLNFRVKYPDPLKTDPAELKKNGTQPQYWLEKDYYATIPVEIKGPVYFHPGQCTIINIKLNHKDETMTIGAQYTDWDFVPTPDEGSLKKNSTFLKAAPEFANRPTSGYVTIAKDDIATEDDATWLYYQREANGTTYSTDANGNRILLDIYGHTGNSMSSPYTICTADQLLSFAYEVSNGGVDGTGNSFAGKYIKLDAGIIMQEDTEKDAVSWIGIGTASTPFQGTFLGSERKITRLKGKPLFNYVGASALIDKVIIENTLSTKITKDSNGSDVETPNPGLTGNAALAENNAGTICACRVNGAIYSSSTGTVGSLVGTNTGTVFACHHTGFVKGSGTVCGLVGSNSGSILFSYHAGELEGTTKYGIAPSGSIHDCFYDNKLAPSVTAEVTGATGKDTRELQAQTFVDDVYTEAEAEAENSKTEHLKTDSNGKNPGDDGYERTYKDDYTPVKEGDPYPGKNQKAWNTRMQDWVNASATSDKKTHFNTHSYLYQPAAYPKVR